MKAAAVKAGYAEGSSVWLKQRLADEIIERSKHMLAGHAVRAVNRLVSTITHIKAAVTVNGFIFFQ